MTNAFLRIWMVFLGVSLFSETTARARDLTFEERVKAQEAIERVYHSHQIGATKPFEEAVPRDVLEEKVHTYLKKSVALEQFWNTSITADALWKELERIARNTRFPERLEEIYEALDKDALLIRECFARQILVNRMTRNFFAFDDRIHRATRNEAEELRHELLNHEMDALSEDPRRTVVDIIRTWPGMAARFRREGADGAGGEVFGSVPIELDPEEFARWRAQLPQRMGEIGPLIEEREAFVLRVVLEEGPQHVRVATYIFPKVTWEEWWARVRVDLDERSAAGVANEVSVFPSPAPRVSIAGSGDAPTDPVYELTSLLSENAPCVPAGSWGSSGLGGVPDGRLRHTAVWTGSLMIVWGGLITGGAYLSTGGRYDPLTDSWEPTSTEGVPTPRWGHTAVWTGTHMLVWGGFDGSHLATGGRYDPHADTWSPISTNNAPAPRYLHSAIWTGTRMVVWGGVGTTSQLGNGGRYDPAADTWSPTSGIGAPDARYSHSAVWTGSLMLVWGGTTLTGQLPVIGGRYDPVSDSWSPTSTLGAPAGRSDHTAVWTGTHMLVWGGGTNTGGRYDPTANTWQSISTANAPAARSFHSAVWTGSLMVVWGGSSLTRLNTGGRYDPVADVWTATSTLNAPSPRSMHTAVWTNSLMVVWGGWFDNTGGRYDPSADRWTATSTGNSPEGRSGTTAVWTGSQMVVWGGRNSQGARLRTGGRYDPLVDEWTPTATLNSPTGREFPAAVWTGTAMVVWGGFDGFSALATGGRYDPVADRWAPTSTVNSPTARFQHTAVWTGDLMLVWGGRVSFDPFDTGGRYDPLTDSWSTTSRSNAPSARYAHTALWTGRFMLVWGGLGGLGFGHLNTGGRYDPAADSWAPTSTVNAPAPRVDHTAVWTGDLMVVWGGGDSSFKYNTGGRYDPVTDTWTSTSIVNPPAARVAHTAIWTGTLMIVWGGVGDSTFYAGGRYDPLSDSWTPTTTVNAPKARWGHVAVWTSSEMIVWGDPFFSNTGGRYEPGPNDCDGDGVEDATDCAPADGGAFAVPSEVMGLMFGPGGTTLSWESAAPLAGDATAHDVARGSLAELPVGSGASELCLASGTAISTTDPSVPPFGGGFWYLVRGKNACGAGTYGRSSDGLERVTVACP